MRLFLRQMAGRLLLRRPPQAVQQPPRQFAEQFGLRRVREDRLRDLGQRHLAGHHHHADTDQGVGMVGEVVHADDAARGLVGHQLDHALGFAGDHRLGIDAHRHLGFHRVDALGFGLRHRQADEAGLRTREGDATVLVLVVFAGMAEQVAGGDTALGGGGVGQHVAADDVADRVDMRRTGLAAGVDLDRRAVELDADLVEVELAGVGALAGGHQDDVAVEYRLDAFFICVAQLHRARFAARFLDVGAGDDGDFLLQRGDQGPGDFLLDFGEDAFVALQHQHLGAEVAEDLRHFHADHAAADEAEFLRRGGEVPDGVGGDHAARRQVLARAGNRRHEGGGAGGDDRRAKADGVGLALDRGDLQRVGVGEIAVTFAHVDLHALVGLQRHVTAAALHPAAVLLDLGPVERRRIGAVDAHFGVVRAVADAVGGSAPGLGRDAAAPLAFAAGEGSVVDNLALYAVIGVVARAVFAYHGIKVM